MKCTKSTNFRFFVLSALLLTWIPACQSQETDPFAEARQEEELQIPEFPQAEQTEWLQLAEGELIRVDPEAGVLAVRTPEGTEMKFRYDLYTEVTGAEFTVEGLSAQQGTQLRIHFSEDSAGYLARRIEVQADAE